MSSVLYTKAVARLPLGQLSFVVYKQNRWGVGMITHFWSISANQNNSTDEQIIKSSQVAFNKTSDNRTSFTGRLNDYKIVKNQYTIK